MIIISSLLLGIVLIMADATLATHNWITMTPAELQKLRLGPLEMDAQHSTSSIKLVPIFGVVMLAGGATLVFGNERHAAKQAMQRSDAGHLAHQQPGGNLNPSKQPGIIRKSA